MPWGGGGWGGVDAGPATVGPVTNPAARLDTEFTLWRSQNPPECGWRPGICLCVRSVGEGGGKDAEDGVASRPLRLLRPAGGHNLGGDYECEASGAAEGGFLACIVWSGENNAKKISAMQGAQASKQATGHVYAVPTWWPPP